MKSIIKKSLQSLLIVPALALGVSFVAPVLQPADAHAQFDQGLQEGLGALVEHGSVEGSRPIFACGKRGRCGVIPR